MEFRMNINTFSKKFRMNIIFLFLSYHKSMSY